MRKKPGSDSGFILADVLVALFIAAIALSALLTGVAHAARLVSMQGERVTKLVSVENERTSKAAQILTPGE
jgi:hypothetical protein